MDVLEDPLAAAAARKKEKRRRKKQHKLITQSLLDDDEHAASSSDVELPSKEENDVEGDDAHESHTVDTSSWTPPPIPVQIVRFIDVLAEENDENGTSMSRTPIKVREVNQFSMLASRFARLDGPRSTVQPLGTTFADAVTQTVVKLHKPAAATAATSEMKDNHHTLQPKPSQIQAACWGLVLGDGNAIASMTASTRDQSNAPSSLGVAGSTCVDVILRAPTGSGKTLAFLVPIVARAIAMKSSNRQPVADSTDSVRQARELAKIAFVTAKQQGRSDAEAKEIARTAYLSAGNKNSTGNDSGDAGGTPDTRDAKPGTASASVASPTGGREPADNASGHLVTAFPRHLVLAPTRELCQQTGAVLASLLDRLGSPISTATVIGGEGFTAQSVALQRAQPDIVIATPGRLLSLCGEKSQSSRATAAAKAMLSSTSSAGGDGSAVGAVPCALSRVVSLVLDEADRLMDMGFGADVLLLRSLISPPTHAPVSPPTPWTVLCSATFDATVQQLTSQMLKDDAVYIRVGAGESREAVRSVTQTVEVLRGKGAPRFRRLLQVLHAFGVERDMDDVALTTAGRPHPTVAASIVPACVERDSNCNGPQAATPTTPPGSQVGSTGAGLGGDAPTEENAPPTPTSCGLQPPRAKVLVFVMYKQEAKDVAKSLTDKGVHAMALTGDMSQAKRTTALKKFRDSACQVLVATDVASRGLDVEGITHVVNFALGFSVDTYVHRIGRCGRAGNTGTSHTFVMDGDAHLAASLIDVLHDAGQRVPPELHDLARKHAVRTSQHDPSDAANGDEVAEARQRNAEKQRRLREAANQRSRGGDTKGHRRGKKKK
eukprot:m.15268 g.15268  ORF g.15268 m.15268 type:complete len:832 (-) comp10691_c0_seq2:204-2699(-)